MKIQNTEAYKRYALNSDVGEFFDIEEAEEEMQAAEEWKYECERDDEMMGISEADYF